MNRLGKIAAAPFTDMYSSYASIYQGGFRPTMTGATVGAAAGAGLGSMVPENDASAVVGSAAVGAGIGALSLPAMGAVGAGALWGMSKVPGAAKAVGSVAGSVGKAGLPVAAKALDFAGSNSNYNPLYRYGKAASKMFDGVIKYTPEKTWIDKKGDVKSRRGRFRPTTKGKLGLGALVAGGAITSVSKDAINERQGTQTGVRRATPNYLDDAGATGDLVFAMNANRNG